MSNLTWTSRDGSLIAQGTSGFWFEIEGSELFLVLPNDYGRCCPMKAQDLDAAKQQAQDINNAILAAIEEAKPKWLTHTAMNENENENEKTLADLYKEGYETKLIFTPETPKEHRDHLHHQQGLKAVRQHVLANDPRMKAAEGSAKLSWRYFADEDVWRAYRYAFEYEIEQSEDGWDIQINFQNSVADCPNLDVFSTGSSLPDARELCQCHADAAERPFLAKETTPAAWDKKYLPWTLAGGPNECIHGYAAGIPCPKCDEEKHARYSPSPADDPVRKALVEIREGLRQVALLSNINKATREIIVRLGNEANAALKLAGKEV